MKQILEGAISVLFFFLLTSSTLFIWDISKEMKLTRIALEKIVKMEEAKFQIVTLSAYHPPTRGINSDKNPKRTALMRKPKPGWTAACSDELAEMGWMGKKVYLKGYGVWKIEDKMNKSVKGKRLDLCAPTLKLANKFGIESAVLAVILD